MGKVKKTAFYSCLHKIIKDVDAIKTEDKRSKKKKIAALDGLGELSEMLGFNKKRIPLKPCPGGNLRVNP